MARFPLETDSVPTVNPAGAPDVHQRIDASPDAFGAAIGRGLQGFGQGLEKASSVGFEVAREQEQMDARTHASEVHTWESERVTEAQEQFLAKKGKAAQMALPEFRTRIDEIHKEARDQAGNRYTEQLIDTEGRRLGDVARAGATRHAVTEARAWETKTAANNAAEAGSRAAFLASQSPLENVSDDLTVAQQLTRSDLEVRNLAESQGYDAPAIKAEVEKNRGRNVKQVVELLASDGSPTGVKRGFDFYKANEEKIDAGSRLAIQNYLKGPLNTIAGQRIADEVLGRPPVKTPPETVADVPANFIGAIKGSEGFAPVAKWDYKQDTNGFGTKAAYKGEVIDVATANKRFNAAITEAAKFVDSVNPNLDPGTRAAMASLTFNAGTAWANAGLGEAIRAGDLAKAKELFLQYNKAGGETNEGLVQRRAREASWFGRGDLSAAEVNQPMIPRGQAMLRIMDDPSLANRPQVQAAALAHLTKLYQAYELQGAQDNAAFKLKLANSTAEALDNGTVKQPLGHEEFIAAMGGTEGEKAWLEYQKNIQFGAVMRATAAMAPADLASLRERYKPQPGDTYVEQRERSAALDKAIAANEKAKAKDPADFLITRTDFGREAYQQFQTLMGQPNNTPQMQSAYAAMFAEKMLAEQTRLGVPADARRVVPSAYIDALNAKLENPATAGGSLGVAQQIESEARLWGKYWPDVYRQLSEKSTPVVRVIGSGVQPIAAQMLVDLAPLSLSAILKDQDTEKNAQIRKDVLDAFKPLAASMSGNDGATSIFNDFRGQAEKLAARYVISGMTSSEAAAKAYEQMIGYKYTFQDGYRVPKDAGVDPSTVAKGTVAAQQELGKPGLEVAPAADTMGGLSADYLTQGKIRSLQRDGKWVTSPDEKGLMLVHNDQAVRRPDGTALTLSWQQLSDLAARRKLQIDEALQATGTGGPF